MKENRMRIQSLSLYFRLNMIFECRKFIVQFIDICIVVNQILQSSFDEPQIFLFLPCHQEIFTVLLAVVLTGWGYYHHPFCVYIHLYRMLCILTGGILARSSELLWKIVQKIHLSEDSRDNLRGKGCVEEELKRIVLG